MIGDGRPLLLDPRARRAPAREADLGGRPRGDVAAPPGDDRPEARCGGDGDPRARARPGPPGEPGAAGREGPRPPARDPLRGEGPPRHEGHSHHVGRRAAARAGVRLRRHGRPAAGGGGGGAGRQAGHGRAGGGPGLQQPRRELHRPGAHALEPGLLERGLVERPRVGGGGGPRALRDRQRDVRLDPHPRGLLRRHRPAAHLRPRLAPRRDGPVLDARQARPPRAGSGRLRPRARRHRRSGPRGPDHGRELPLPGARDEDAAGPASASTSASCATRPRAATRMSRRASGRPSPRCGTWPTSRRTCPSRTCPTARRWASSWTRRAPRPSATSSRAGR